MPRDRQDDYNDRDREERAPSGAMVPQGRGSAIARRSFAGEELEIAGVTETASIVLAAQAKAMVEARFIMARKYPRDWADVRTKLLRACERTGFATGYLDPGVRDPKKAMGAAWYNKPIGDGVQGFSIRFAEEAMRCMRNIDVNTITLYDDWEKRILSVVVTDLENNIALPTSILVEKSVERRKVQPGTEVIRTRSNSYGDTLYIIAASEDEVFQKQQSLSSKAIRNALLRLLPGDIAAECRQRILEIRQGDIAKDPDKAAKGIADAFAAMNVLPSSLKEYLGHEIGVSTPAEIQDLRDLYDAIRAGTITWVNALEEALEARGEGKKPEEEGEKDKSTNGDPARKLTETLKGRRGASSKATPPEEKRPEEKEEAADEETKKVEPVTREPGDEPDKEITPEMEKRLDIVDLIAEFTEMKQRQHANGIVEMYGETNLSNRRSDHDTVAEIPAVNLGVLKTKLEKKLAELKSGR